MITAIISGGVVSDYTFFADNLRKCDFIICADGGIKHLINVNIPPDVFIGDFDSCDLDSISKSSFLSNSRIIKYNPVKDDTDMQLCINWALDNGYKDIRIFAALGGRIDHELSNILNLKYTLENGANASIISENNYIFITDNTLTVNKLEGYKLSLISLTETSKNISLDGLYYPLKNADLRQGSSLGVSNEFVESTARISVGEGILLVILSKDAEE